MVGAELATTREATGTASATASPASTGRWSTASRRSCARRRRGSRCPREFVVPGETRLSAALELARTILRRAERRAVTLKRDGSISGDHLLPYLNRLADLLWVLARAAEQAEADIDTGVPRAGSPQHLNQRRAHRPRSRGIRR